MRINGSKAACLAIVLAAGFVCLDGCQRQSYQLASVSGRVTLNNQPLQGIDVSFQPIAASPSTPRPGPGSYGTTDTDGRFTLRTVQPNRDGAVVGRHVVRLSRRVATAVASDNSAPVDRLIPTSFADGSLEFEVPVGGTTAADFELSQP